MKPAKEELEINGVLRTRAEAVFQANWSETLEDVDTVTTEGYRRIVHELRVHQIELEMQNEELRVAQEKLDAARAHYSDLYNRAPLGYCTVNEQGRILEANFTAAGLLGTDCSTLIQQPFTRFILSEDQDIYYLHRKQLIATRSPNSCEVRMVRQDGSSFWAHLDATVIRGEDGTPLSRLVLSDISSRRQYETDLENLRRQQQLSQNMETLGRLAGGVAHDMNNVLAAILGLASANLELQPKDSRAYHAFDIISQAAVRGGNTVKSLLAFAHQKPAEEQDVDLNGVLQEEVRLLERTTLSKVSLEMDLDPNLPPIRGDFNALSSAVMNLCVNAVDAMPGDGTLSLRTRNMGDHWVEVVVEDNGSGMPEEVQAKALDPFFTTKDVGKGTGLGLSMVYRTVEAHGGHMAIDSEVGRGTRIELFFPTCEIPAEPPRDVIEPFLGRPRTALQVLVVDDDELIHTAMRTLIQALGHKVTIAESGEEALAQIEAGFEPDVMILDMNMPGLGGVGTLPRLRVLRPKMPVLIATGRVDQVTLDLIAAHPLTTLMPKPFGMEQLRKHLDAFQSKSRTDAVPRRAQRAGGERRRAEPMHHAGYSGAIRPLGFKGMERRMDAGADRRRH